MTHWFFEWLLRRNLIYFHRKIRACSSSADNGPASFCGFHGRYQTAYIHQMPHALGRRGSNLSRRDRLGYLDPCGNRHWRHETRLPHQGPRKRIPTIPTQTSCGKSNGYGLSHHVSTLVLSSVFDRQFFTDCFFITRRPRRHAVERL
jgi:hypothetical protein